MSKRHFLLATAAFCVMIPALAQDSAPSETQTLRARRDGLCPELGNAPLVAAYDVPPWWPPEMTVIFLTMNGPSP